MSEIAITVEGLGKRYRIGANQQAYKTLKEKLTQTATAPFRAAQHLLTRNGNGNSQSAIRNSKSGAFWALKDVSFEVKRGDVLGIIGRNGAGKSTLLKILSRITEPTEGYADIHGRVASLLEVGTGFQPELTGRENILLNGSILGMKHAEIRRRFDEIVAFAEVEQFIDTPVKHYSSGMYVRLAFAVAAHLDPEILLVDEVLAVGDAEFQKKCLGKMDDVVSKEGRTIMFVSHNIDAICHLCSRCILLRHGEIELSGNTAEVVAAYLGAGQQQPPVVYFKAAGSEASFQVAGLHGPEGEPSTSFSANTPVLMKCSFTLQRSIPGLQVSFSVFNFKGEEVFYSTNSMAEPAISVESAGTHHVSAMIPARLLLPGRYFINLALHIPNVHLYDRRDQALGFQIVGMPGGYQGFPTEELGQVYADVKWEKTAETRTEVSQ